MKITTIIGARLQFIKAAMVSRALRARQGVREILVHTGQDFNAKKDRGKKYLYFI